jgi:hypothetical protein
MESRRLEPVGDHPPDLERGLRHLLIGLVDGVELGPPLRGLLGALGAPPLVELMRGGGRFAPERFGPDRVADADRTLIGSAIPP